MKDARFDKAVLESLTEDELALLYLLYHKLFNREVDLRCVFVQPVLSKIKEKDHNLTLEGKEARDRLVEKIEAYYK
jgi:hypothetical protein